MQEWNIMALDRIEKEGRYLSAGGWHVLIMGDLNGHEGRVVNE